MAVRSEELKQEKIDDWREQRAQDEKHDSKRRKGSSLVTRGDLRKRRGKVERIAALVVLVLSFAGSAAALGGGWGVIATGKGSIVGIGFGLLLQAVLTFIQWSYADNRLLAWGSRAVDAALTAAGYGPLFFGTLLAWVVAQGASSDRMYVIAWEFSPAVAGTWFILWLVSLLPAWFPENRLID